MKPLKFKSNPLHKFSVIVLPSPNVDKNWFNVLDPIEIEAEIDGKLCIIEIHDISEIEFSKLALNEYIVKLALGFTIKEFKEILIKGYGDRIKNTKIAIILYKLIEVC